MLTLGALENTSLATLGKSTVELVGEGGLGHAGEVVVGLDVFLESLTAVGRNESAKNAKDATRTVCDATNLLPARSLSYCSQRTTSVMVREEETSSTEAWTGSRALSRTRQSRVHA
jgi:hypothetical protein